MRMMLPPSVRLPHASLRVAAETGGKCRCLRKRTYRKKRPRRWLRGSCHFGRSIFKPSGKTRLTGKGDQRIIGGFPRPKVNGDCSGDAIHAELSRSGNTPRTTGHGIGYLIDATVQIDGRDRAIDPSTAITKPRGGRATLTSCATSSRAGIGWRCGSGTVGTEVDHIMLSTRK